MKEGTRRRGRRRTLLLDIRKKKRRLWNSKEEALDRTLWRTGLGTNYGLDVRRNAHCCYNSPRSVCETWK